VIRVLLLDDHPVVRDGFKRLLLQTGQIDVVGDFGDAEQALLACRQQAPDVVVLDLSLGPVHGLDWMLTLLRQQPQTRVLVFSMHDAAPLVKRALSLGASGFVSKQAQPDSLVSAVLAVSRGERYLSADLALRAEQQQRGPGPQLDSNEDLLATLTPKEWAVFRGLAQGQSVAAIADQLGLSAKTVSNHQTTIKEKLRVETTAALVHIALNHTVLNP
jgi:DNA-binding NarL/FixJ family response regulator